MGIRTSLSGVRVSQRARRIRRCVVVIPAHNEDATLADALAAVSRSAAGVDVPVRVVVVLDACTDDSAARVHPGVEMRSIASRSVGRARSAGFVDADAGSSTWYATTDADSRVPERWLSWQIGLADAGHDAVVGTVEVADWTGWPAHARERFAAHYAEGGLPSDAHRHVHGANLGVRASIYHQMGGFAAIDRDEDVDLVRRLVRAGRPLAWNATMPVVTSPRRVGRAPAGFATSLPAIVDAAL